MLSLTTSLMKNLSLRNSNLNMILKNEIHTTVALERARPGTRVRKRKQMLKDIKAKAERLRKNPPPIPYKVELMLKSKGLWGPPKPLRTPDKDLPFPKDDVYFAQNYAYKRYAMEEAINNLKQLCHPSMMDEPDALVNIKVEFDMRANKKDRYIDGFTKTVAIVKPYDRGVPDRNVVCFVPNEDLRLQALQAGAVMAGGHELIMEISKGQVDIAEVDFFLCHEELIKQLGPLRSVVRDKTPNAQNGTIGIDIVRMIQTFAKGMALNVEKVKPAVGVADEPDYGHCVATIGRLGMEVDDMKANLTAVLDVLDEMKPKRKDGTGFITRVMLYCLPNQVASISKHYYFSIMHPLIYDPRVDEQVKVLAEGREQIAENVRKLKASTE